MKISQTFIRTTKSLPGDETARNAQLLIQAGYVSKEMAGVYDYLPLGLIVVENIKSIIRQEMDKLGASEILMSTLQNKDVWQKTGRWNDESVDVWFKSNLKNGSEVGFGWSHEEPLMALMSKYVNSYKDLPIAVYQFQTKLRNELRSKSGLMRGREFIMKDMYAFSKDQSELDSFYNKSQIAYMNVFTRLGLGDETYFTYASGGAFTKDKFSHEFQTILDNGEDIIYVDQTKKIAINQEIYSPEILKQLNIDDNNLQKFNATEVGNIFNFGKIKGEQMDIYYSDVNNKQQPLYLSSYGIGVSRLMGVIAEKSNDEKGLIWPVEIAPALVYLIAIGGESETKLANRLVFILTENGVKVIYDDRKVRPGEKFADADLLGIPWRVVINNGTLTSNLLELKPRTSDKIEYLSMDNLLKKITTEIIS